MSKKVIEGDVDLSDIWMDEIPDFLSVDELQGNLRIDQYKYPSLRSLKNSPRLVKGTVVINSTNIRDLQGSPQMILGNFELDANAELDSLKGAPRYVTGIFSVQYLRPLRNQKAHVGAPNSSYSAGLLHLLYFLHSWLLPLLARRKYTTGGGR